jgi:hypothetical protein
MQMVRHDHMRQRVCPGFNVRVMQNPDKLTGCIEIGKHSHPVQRHGRHQVHALWLRKTTKPQLVSASLVRHGSTLREASW